LNNRQLTRGKNLWQSGLIGRLLFNNRRIASLLAIVTLVVGLVFVPSANAELNDRVNQVKAAFILNIIRFVSWPEESGEDKKELLLLCLYRDDLLNRALVNIHGKKSNGRTIQVRHIDTLADSHSCHILVIANDSIDHFVKEIPLNTNRPMLTMVDLTESEASLTQQGDVLVALIRKGSRIGFQINLNKSRKAGLWMSSKLLKLATIVGRGR